MAGFTALFLTSRMGVSCRNVAQGHELEVIGLVVLAGYMSLGKGRIAGAAARHIYYGLGLVNIQAQVLLIIVGLLSILCARSQYQVRGALCGGINHLTVEVKPGESNP